MIEQFSFLVVIQAARKNYRVVLFVLAFAIASAATYMHIAPNQYEAAMVIAPTASSLADDNPNIGGLGSGLVSSLIGGPGQLPRTFSEFANLISSNFLATTLLADEKVKLGVYPGIWDERAHRWRERSEVWRKIKLLIGVHVSPYPSPQDLADYLDKTVILTDIPRSDLYKVTYRNADPQFAVYLLSEIYKVLDADLKERFVRRHAANLNYIDQVIARTDSPDLRTAMTALYMQEQRRMMLAASNLPFSADMVDRPTVSATPVAPNAAVVFGAAIFLGFIMGIMAAVICERRPEIASLKMWGLGSVLFPQHTTS